MDFHPPLVFHRFPDLPEDIGRTIFEVAAEAYHGPIYALVSKKIQSWVEPLIYRRIVLSSTAQAQLFYRTFRGPSPSKTLAFFEQHVRVFILSALSRTRDVAAVLEVCKGIKTLAIWSHKSSEETKNSIASPFLSPTRLSIIAELFFSGQHHFSHPIFQNVTHLEVVCYDNDDWEWDTLSQLQHLTHLSFDSRYFLVPPPSFSQLVKNTISSCPVTLRVFVLWIDSSLPVDYDLEDINSIYEGRADSRAVVACEGDPGGEAVIQIQMYRGFPDILKDWAGLSEGRDFWTEAEDRIEERRQRLTETPQ